MKKYLYIAVALIFVISPVVVHAAFNDATLETTALINVGGYDLTIYGSSAEITSITVNADTFSVTLDSGSAIIVASADRVGFSHDGGAVYVTSEVCSDTESRFGLAAGNTTTITVTPSGTCTAEESDGGRSGRRRPTSDIGVGNAPITLEQLQLQLIELLKQLLAELVKGR